MPLPLLPRSQAVLLPPRTTPSASPDDGSGSGSSVRLRPGRSGRYFPLRSRCRSGTEDRPPERPPGRSRRRKGSGHRPPGHYTGLPPGRPVLLSLSSTRPGPGSPATLPGSPEECCRREKRLYHPLQPHPKHRLHDWKTLRPSPFHRAASGEGTPVWPVLRPARRTGCGIPVLIPPASAFLPVFLPAPLPVLPVPPILSPFPPAPVPWFLSRFLPQALHALILRFLLPLPFFLSAWKVPLLPFPFFLSARKVLLPLSPRKALSLPRFHPPPVLSQGSRRSFSRPILTILTPPHRNSGTETPSHQRPHFHKPLRRSLHPL